MRPLGTRSCVFRACSTISSVRLIKMKQTTVTHFSQSKVTRIAPLRILTSTIFRVVIFAGGEVDCGRVLKILVCLDVVLLVGLVHTALLFLFLMRLIVVLVVVLVMTVMTLMMIYILLLDLIRSRRMHMWSVKPATRLPEPRRYLVRVAGRRWRGRRPRRMRRRRRVVECVCVWNHPVI